MSDLLRNRTARPAIASSWTKSYLSHANGNCVEVADLPERHVGMRESKDAGGLVLRFSPEEWRALLNGAWNGKGDRIVTRERNANFCRAASRWQLATFDGIQTCMLLHSLPQCYPKITVVGASAQSGLLSVGFNNEPAVAQVGAVKTPNRIEFK